MSSLAVGSPDHGLGISTQFSTLVDLLEWRARFQADRVAYTFLADNGTDRISLSWSQLHRKAQLIGQQLTAMGAAGKTVLLLYPSDLEYVAAFFGCLYAGAIAVPAYPPRRNRTMNRLQAIVADSQASLALSVSFIQQRIEPLCKQSPGLNSLKWLTTDDLHEHTQEEWHSPLLTGEMPAFLQYTSGSTSQPKGVIVSHGNLMHNEQLIQQAFDQTESSIIVGWLPLYHDMGLIGNVLQTLYVGARCVLMSPATFLQSPFSWLQAISVAKATTSGGPNFAYDLCVRKVSEEQRAQLDLSSWKVAFNGAEPIRPATLKRFAKAFASCGFKPEAFHPCYGLAEATLFVSGKAARGVPKVESFSAGELIKNRVLSAARNGSEAKSLISCGVSFGGQRLAVVNPDTSIECGVGEVGEIWLAGPSVAGGYWKQPEATAHTFHAKLVGDELEDRFLRTGDLGFLHDGELYVTGRLKDLIIIRGLNHYPQDVEQTAELSHAALRPGCNAAFSLEVEGEERLVIVQEVHRNRAVEDKEIVDAIRQRVTEEHEVQVYSVALIRQGTITKTSSGKIQRNACKRAFVTGKLEVEFEWRETAKANQIAIKETKTNGQQAGADSPESWLRAKLAALLRVDVSEIDVNKPITRYGLDSLMVVELSHGIEEKFGVSIPLASLFESVSVVELCERLGSPEVGSRNGERPASNQPSANVQPLSSSQQSLWFLHQLAPQDPTYNLAFAARVRGSLDVRSLRGAFQALVDRHGSLRTTFADDNGALVRRVVEHTTVHFEEDDASAWDQATVDERLGVEAQRPFDLEHGPLLKVHLFRRADGENVLLLTAHHIIVDMWSLTVLMHELGVLYNAQRSGTPADLPPLTRQYVDYVQWQNDLLQSEQGLRHRHYWQEQLAGPLPGLALPTDRPRPPVQTYRGAAHTFNLNPELTRRLKALSKDQNATLYMTLLAAFQVLLYRYSGQQEILVGSPTSGRNRGWLAGLVGYLVNPVVLRANLAPEQSFSEFLSDVRRTVLAAFEHQDYPFALQVQDVQPERDASRSPVFQVMFALQKSHLRNDQSVAAFAVGDPGAQIPLGDVVLESLTLPQRSARFDITLLMAEADEHLGASLEYNTDLFDATTIDRLSQQFEQLLDSIVTEPHTAVSRLPILNQKEQQLLATWNNTQREYPRGESMHGLFEAQVGRTPGAVAIVAGSERLTYQELNQRANRLAHHLIALGVSSEDRVGILLDRSSDMLISVLAVLKTGGCYVPLDPAYPRDRVEFMMADAGSKVLVTTQFLADPRIANQPSSNPCISVADNQLGYLIYTSGSTGRPKGVAIEHASATAFVHWASSVFSDEDLRSVLFSTSICFDLSIFEMFVTLSRGGQIVFANNALHLAELPAANEVTLINTVPSAMTELLRMRAVPDSVRVVNLAGEPLTDELVAEIYANTQAERVYNLYGPSEYTTYSTYTLCEDGEHVTIGRPVANTRVYVVDEQLQPVPVGVIGDLYINGAGLARGYWQRPEMTAEKFIPDSLSGDAGARLYRTGDKARYLASGNLEFLGRADHQVKLRGYRIELGEIESVLRRHEQVQEAIVVARDQEGEEKRLVAYVVAEAPARVSELRAWLRERLPEFMTPAAFVLLDALPLTPNGKIDRKALPAPDFSTASEESFTAPRTQIEEVLLGIWANVLGIKDLGIHDNFFELGGHSLMATRLISQVRNELQVELLVSKVFESPTVARLAEHVEQSLRDAPAIVYTPIETAPREEPLPLSFAQQRLWFLDQMEPGNPFYNISAVVRMKGPLNVRALEQSFGEIVNRHEVLRTRFDVVDGQPMQIVTPALSWSLPVIDVHEHEVAKRATEEAQTPFDLATGQLLRTTLLQLNDEEHALLVTMHHIVSDAWSVGIFIRELNALYASFADEQELQLSALPVQYADFAHWQQCWLQGDVLAAQMAYWKQHLAGAPALLNFPTDRPRPAVQKFQGESETLVLDGALAESLKILSRRQGATLFMTLLAAFKTLLFRYSGQSDIVVGTPVAGRNRADIESLIGFFVNTQAIRTQLSPDMSFSGLLSEVRSAVLEGQARQDLPFEKLVEELQPERSLSHTPIFQVMFALQNVPMPTLELAGLTVDCVAATVKTAKFDFSLSFEENADGLVGTLEYNTDLFDAATMTRLLGHYEQLLEGVVSGEETKLGDLQLLTDTEREQLLSAWNDTTLPQQSSLCVHQQFEQHAQTTPNAIAVLCDDRTLTYGELNAQSNKLAQQLRRLGVRPESIVAICTDRSLEMFVGVLGVLKAGGAYLPIDPNYPLERRNFMIEDSGASVVLTPESINELVSKGLDHEAPTTDVDLDNLAYVIYTSGSTGRPKGVAVSHGALLNLVSWHNSTFNISASDRATLLAGVSFDASVWELWPYMSYGASLDLPPDDLRSSPEGLRDWITRRAVTISFVPTPVAEPMLALEWSFETKLRTLLTGGDRLHTWPTASFPFAVVNNYGPTENAVVSTSGLVGREGGAPGTAPTLGRPIGNVGIYIVDQRGEPVPVGVTGELWVGGDSQARCYLNRPGLSAEMFVPDALSGKAGARLYRTGDLARYLPNGEIEFLGRSGSQVKIRGHRIELGEIETALRETDGVREAVVNCWEQLPGDQCLVAYVVRDESAVVVTSNDLRSTLREQLPDYMVPSFVVLLDELPLTDNGKIDRRALPVPAPANVHDDAAPRTPTEELLSNIWAQILRLRSVGLHDNFFDLGGHSLLATQVVSRVRETFNVELLLRALFEHPTIAGLAQSIDTALQAEAVGTLTPIERVDRAGKLPLSFAQQRLWFIDKLSSGNTVYNIQVAVRLLGQLDRGALEKALNEILRRHEVLRTSLAVKDGVPIQIVAPEYSIALPLTNLSGSTLESVCAEEGRYSFDLERLPLVRFRLLRLAENKHVLLLTMHHIISDGWSLGVITQELASLYRAFASDKESPLSELPVQYADFAHWQREWLTGEVLENQIAYWKKQLGQIANLELPTDRPRPSVQSFRGARRFFTLPADLAESLGSFSRREGVTLYMLMLAGFKVLLNRYSNQDDIVVGTDIANRNRSEIEPLIGFFANQLVLRTSLAGNPTFRELLGRVREVTLGAYAHQDMPFEKIVEELAPERDLGRNPLFQVMFIFQNNPMPALEIGDLTIEPIEMTEATTAFDITLALNQTPNGEIRGSVRYSTDLFDSSRIDRMTGHYETLLRSIVTDADARLSALEMFTEEEHKQKVEHKEERRESKLKKLLSVKPKAVKLSERNLVRETRISDQTALPVVFQPEIEGVDLINWAGQNRETIDSRLQQHGALLFRGFNGHSLANFEQFTTTIASSLMSYGERSSPRHAISGNIYTSTDHPADQHILLHNEQSYTLNWPMKIWFFCVRPAHEGGRTPIADSRRIYQRLPAPVVQRFVEKQVMYVRNYGDMLGLSWQEAFQTDDKRIVEEHCRRDAIEFEWKDENRLRTKQIRPAVRQHPRTGETVWFNHAVFFNIHSLEKTARESLRAGIDDFDLPFNTFYGDGSTIEPADIEQIYEAYRQEQVAFDWQTGDILMLDNMLCAHGREPFVAPREIAVAMAEPYAALGKAI
ncbi:MAG TPA: amino acid adenylation domain-containing protein [Pyrinomonadaceae bacterium]|nr:amino acid adenylation domain-containing protein [Pyrinomonadaceae bacterium]